MAIGKELHKTLVAIKSHFQKQGEIRYMKKKIDKMGHNRVTD